jgi:ATP-dependent Zn protease
LPTPIASYIRRMHRETYTAYHEAGHAVIGRVLGLECGSVTIVPDDVGMGCTTTKSPLAALDAWEARGRSRFNGHDLRSVYRAYVMELMAGREAAELCCGPGGSFTGDQDDIRQIETLINLTYDLDRESWPSPSPQVGDFNLERLRKATRSLCIRHREKIERVAQALLKRKTLSPKAIDNLMRMCEPWQR